ncbi:MAG: hypothetical protein K0R26_2523 [Bacteroidota bacterium]|nr:hypothetical protein [Bacteroidota bacterium]
MLTFSLTQTAASQSIKKNLLSANAIQFRQSIYVYGYEQAFGNLSFKCFSYSRSLQLLDSVSISLGKHSVSDYLEITADTLHDVLNFYFQLANKKNDVSIFRVNDTLHPIGFTVNTDANHINSFSAFLDEKFYFRENLYTLRAVNDSIDKQFYLSRYALKDLTKPFEYEFKWQYPLERKHVHSAYILYADSVMVLLSAHVSNGEKKGQWILRIDAATGKVLRGTKLNPKGDARHFLMSKLSFDKKEKQIDIIGSVYEGKMIDFNTKTSDFTNQAKNHKLFLIKIDSAGEIIERIEIPFPLPIQTQSGNMLQSFHLKIRTFDKQPDGSYVVWADIYEQSMPNVFNYYSTWKFNLVPNDVNYSVKRSPLYITSLAVPNLISNKKGDTYGKFLLKDISEYDRMKLKMPLNDVMIHHGTNAKDDPYFILKKTDITSSKKSYYYVYPMMNKLSYKSILDTQQGQHVTIFFTGVTTFITFLTNIGNNEFELKLTSL